MSIKTLSAPIPSDDVVGNTFGFLDDIVTGYIHIPTYAVERLSFFDSMVDNSLHDVIVSVILVCADPVSANFVNFYVVFSGLIYFLVLDIRSLISLVLFGF